MNAGDVRRLTDVEKALKRADCVFHVASFGMSGKEMLQSRRVDEVNLDGTCNILDTCIKCSVGRLIYTSTYNVVFGGQEIRNGTEDLPYFPVEKHVDPYGRSKSLAEQLVIRSNSRPLTYAPSLPGPPVTCLWRLGHCNLMIVCAPWEFYTNGSHILSSLLCLHTSSWRWSRTSTSSAPLQQGKQEVGDGEDESWTWRHHIVMSQSEIIESWVSGLALRAYVSELSVVSTVVAHSSCHLLASHSSNGPDALARSTSQAVMVATSDYGSKLTFSKWSCIFSLCWY